MSGETSRTAYKRLTSISPDLSGHECQTDRAPMLVGTPLPVKLSVFRALGPALWRRRGISNTGTALISPARPHQKPPEPTSRELRSSAQHCGSPDRGVRRGKALGEAALAEAPGDRRRSSARL